MELINKTAAIEMVEKILDIVESSKLNLEEKKICAKALMNTIVPVVVYDNESVLN